MQVTFSGELWYWRGPSPYHFVSLPDEVAAQVGSASGEVSYGWGMIPVAARVGGTDFTTALWPKDGTYVVPVKVAVRRAEGLELGGDVTVRLTIDV